MDRLYLDTQQWNYLVDASRIEPVRLEQLRHRLATKVRRRQVAVVSSLPLVQEVMGAIRNNRAKYSRMRDLLDEVVRQRWLLPLDERHRAELDTGGLLSEQAVYLDRQVRREMLHRSRTPGFALSVADETHVAATSFKREQEAIRSKMLEQLGSELSGTTVDQYLAEWWAGVDIDDWVASVVLDGEQRRRAAPPGHVGSYRQRCPSAWLFTAFRLARIKLNLGEGRSIKPSDAMDAEHCGAGAYYDVLVTDDAAFRSTCQLVPDRPFALETFDDLVARIEAPDERHGRPS